MTEIEAAKIRNKEYVNLVSRSFPEISCLRCGHQDFSILPNINDLSGLHVVTIACMRCGHVEQHLAGTLRQALREGLTPIPLEKLDEHK
jgi:ribosomal protein L37E